MDRCRGGRDNRSRAVSALPKELVVNVSRGALLCGLVIVGAVLSGNGRTVVRAQSPEKSAAIVGGWTLNRDLSDQVPDRPDGERQSGSAGGRRGGRGGGGRGGYGGGQPAAGGGDPEEMARIREAMRDIINPPSHLIIADTGSMIVMTSPDGHTTRLSPDGQKIKEENTKIERKTRWDGEKLVTEINGVGQNKITQTFSVDAERRQLRVAVLIENSRAAQQRTIIQIYDADPR
jgi:hypothetical protein